MTVRTLPVGELAANCYIVWDDDRHAVVIDPGAEGERIRRFTDSESLTIDAVLLTHAHFDHMGGIAALASDAPVYCHTDEIAALSDGKRNLSAWFGTPLAPVANAVSVSDAQEITVGALHFRVMHTPGHTPGCVCYAIDEMLFAGDTLFCESIGRTDFPGGSLSVMQESLRRLMTLDDAVQVYPGHGEPTTIGHERRYNPYIAR